MKQIRLKQQLEELERAREHRIYQTAEAMPPAGLNQSPTSSSPPQQPRQWVISLPRTFLTF